MSPLSQSARCTSCQGTDLALGKLIAPGDLMLGINFKPAENWMSAHTVTAATCLSCGAVNLLLDEAELVRLRNGRST